MDVIGVDFKVHLREVHGYNLELVAMTRNFIIEVKKRFYNLTQCYKCYRRAISEDEMKLHETQCEGKVWALHEWFVDEKSFAEFLIQHARDGDEGKENA